MARGERCWLAARRLRMIILQYQSPCEGRSDRAGARHEGLAFKVHPISGGDHWVGCRILRYSISLKVLAPIG
jgi:hypothetical protein